MEEKTAILASGGNELKRGGIPSSASSTDSSFFFGNQFEKNRISEEVYSAVGEEVEAIDQISMMIQPLILPSLLAMAGFVVRSIVTRKKTKFVEFLLDLVAAIIVGSLVGITVDDMDLSDNMRYAIIAISGMVGPDLAGGIIILGQAFRESPADFLYKHYNAIRGLKEGETPKDKGSTEKSDEKFSYEEWNQKNKDFIDKTFG